MKKSTSSSISGPEETVTRPIDLKCEYEIKPIGLETAKPRFSWVLSHSGRGQYQTAYQIMVSSSPERLMADGGEVWDSGKVVSNRSVNVVYEGIPLESGKTYYWKVRWWEADGNVSPWSDVAIFEMGLLRLEDWKGKWIQGSQLLRKEFIVEKEVARARAHVSGLGYYELHINGSKVGDKVLDPGWTAYEKRVLYSTYNVTEYLRRGNNVIGIILGKGRYVKAYEYGPPKAIIQLDIEFKDRTSISIVTDESWKASDGPIISDDIYNGERYDARLEERGWDEPKYDDSNWHPCHLAKPPGGKLVSQAAFPPIRVTKVIQPVEILNPKPGVYVCDFGQNFTGWVRLRVNGPRGTEVRLKYSELIYGDGTINTEPNLGAEATDIYILKGGGVEEYEPRFTYHGFRYVEVTGFPGTPTLENLEGKVVYSDVESVGGFICSNPLINRIHRNIRWGQLSNLMSVPTDCPQRNERMGWTGDAQLSAEEAILNFWMPGFYEKWIADLKDAQAEDGSIPDVVPPYWKIYPPDPAWGTCYVVIPWLLYLYYGDVRVLEENYDGVKKWVGFLSSQAKDYILPLSKYGDWCPPAHIKPVETPGDLLSTWVYYHDVLTLSRMAEVLGKMKDAERYSELAARIKGTFNRMFLKEDRYATGSQTCNILPLYLDMVPEDKVDLVFKNLVEDIEVSHDKHLNTGIIGTRYLLETLTKYKRADLAYAITAQTSYPSWGYMIKEGATTIWERWENLSGRGMNSHNHIMFGTADMWFYKVLAGINVDPSAPGFERFVIKPYLVGDLRNVSASMRTIKGMVSSEWTRSCGSLTLKIKVPVNSKAEVYIPKIGLRDIMVKESGEGIWRNSKYLMKVEGIMKGREEEDYIIFEVGSGSYLFELTGE